ncbi:GNAT family N-acetyltransferase [Clostridium sporogenes]|uniref:GNAT family N-acetyltransferase n=1 Tax=Clostridium sporogenes TaxID=1509 RepID=UPI002902485F|nr:GNAT family N-acetyltransferase [Clostridium botulinum]
MDIQVINSFKELNKYSLQWENLINSSENPEIFYSWNWISNFLKYMCNKRIEIFTILILDKNEIIGIVPLRIEKRKIGFITARVMCPIVNKTVDYCSFYFHKKYNEYELLKKAFKVIYENKEKWDYIELTNFNTRSRSTYLIKQIVEKVFHGKCFFEQSVMTPYLKYNSIDNKINKKQLKDIERRERKLEKNHNLEIYINAKWDREVWDKFIKLHKEKWEKGIFFNKEYIEFYEELIPKLEEKQQLEFSYLKVDGNIAAIHFGFKTEKKVYYYIPVYSSEYLSKGVGSILLKHIVDNYSKNKMEFDFLRGDEKYKFDWTDTVHMNYNFYIINENRRLYLSNYISLVLWAKKNKTIRKLLKK